MANEEQQQATNPGIVEGLGALTSPFTKGADGYNIPGALLFGAGTGLTTWLLSRLFGIKGGPSLAASVLAGLGGAHIAMAKQNGGDIFNFDYLRELMNNNRAKTGTPPPEKVNPLDAAMNRFSIKTSPRVKGEIVSPAPTPDQKREMTTYARLGKMKNSELEALGKDLKAKGLGNTPMAKALINEMNVRSELAQYKNETGGYSMSPEQLQEFIQKGYENDWDFVPAYQAAVTGVQDGGRTIPTFDGSSPEINTTDTIMRMQADPKTAPLFSFEGKSNEEIKKQLHQITGAVPNFKQVAPDVWGAATDAMARNIVNNRKVIMPSKQGVQTVDIAGSNVLPNQDAYGSDFYRDMSPHAGEPSSFPTPPMKPAYGKPLFPVPPQDFIPTQGGRFEHPTTPVFLPPIRPPKPITPASPIVPKINPPRPLSPKPVYPQMYHNDDIDRAILGQVGINVPPLRIR